MKEFESSGFWWLPGEEDTPAAGTLRVSGTGELRLAITGKLGQAMGAPLSRRHRVILGSVDKSPRGNEVTLTSNILTGTSFGSYAGGREEYGAGRGYFGAHLQDDEDFKFRSFLVKLGGLSEWADSLSGLHREPAPLPNAEKRGQTIPIATYRVPTPPTGRLPGSKITLNMGIRSKSAAHEFTFREEANLQIELEQPLSADKINADFVYSLQNFMTFVSDRAQEVESFTVWRTADLADWQANPGIQVIGARVYPDEDEEERKTVRSDQMLFSLADVDFSAIVEAWLRVAKEYEEPLNIYFGALHGPPAYIDMSYVLAVQVLWLYDARTEAGIKDMVERERRFREILHSVKATDAHWLIDHLGVRPYPPFADALRRLLDRHGEAIDPLVKNRRDAFINQASNTLQYFERRNPDDRSAASRGSDLYWLTQKLRFLIKACFLSELGFLSGQIRTLFRKNELYDHIIGLETRQLDEKN